MRRTSGHIGLFLALSGLFSFSGAAIGGDRTAAEILKEIEEAMKPPAPMPAPIRTSDPRFKEVYKERSARSNALILELYKTAPSHERIPELMSLRWRHLRVYDANGMLKEVDEILSRDKNPKLQIEGAYVRAVAQISESRQARPQTAVDISELVAFLKLAPDDPRGTKSLRSVMISTHDEGQKEAIKQQILKEFPNSVEALKLQGEPRRREAIGKPFDLEFTDAIKGSTVSIKGLKGKVVVIDFWATWCGPCLKEIPNMKKLYAEYRDKGVEFIGVSLDYPKESGGLDKLTSYVKKNEIEWPQYYQGNHWDSKFSASWGIASIPCVFVVDQGGKLISVEARGKLDKMIPELLEKVGREGK